MDIGTAVVVGGTGGIGQAIVESLAQVCRRIVITYNERADIADEVSASLPIQCVPVRADITSEADLRQVASAALALGGPIETVVNAAGASRSLPLTELDSASWLATAKIHLLGPMLVAKAFGEPLLADGGGALVFVSSVAGTHPEPRGHDYVAAKGGLWSLTRSLALDLAPRVTVNSVAPGWISSTRRPRLGSAQEALLGRVPLARFGSPADIAAVVRLLATPGGYVTGQTIVVDGGFSL